MASSNPYSPPKSEVSDIYTSEDFQPINLWSAKGRIGRLRYLAYSTAAMFCFTLFVGLLTSIFGPQAGSIITIVGYVPILIFALMLGVQRSHDMNWSGWTILLSIIPFVGLIWLFKAGTPGENDYGTPPPPNTRAVKTIGLVFPVISFIGILAAIALPAYQKYVQRAQQAQQHMQQR